MTLRNTLVLVGITAVVSAALTRYYWPRIEERVQVEEREVVRTDVRTVTRTIERKDGTRETISETTDKSIAKRDQRTEQIRFAQSQWILGIGVATQLQNLEPVYRVEVVRRVFGPVHAGLSGSTDGRMGVELKLEF